MQQLHIKFANIHLSEIRTLYFNNTFFIATILSFKI